MKQIKEPEKAHKLDSKVTKVFHPQRKISVLRPTESLWRDRRTEAAGLPQFFRISLSPNFQPTRGAEFKLQSNHHLTSEQQTWFNPSIFSASSVSCTMVSSSMDVDHTRPSDFTDNSGNGFGIYTHSCSATCTNQTSSKQTSGVDLHDRDSEDAGERDSDDGKSSVRSVYLNSFWFPKNGDFRPVINLRPLN